MTVFHLGIKIRDFLDRPADELARIFTGPPDELKERLAGELAQGREVIPCGERCDRWSDLCGCRGHEE